MGSSTEKEKMSKKLSIGQTNLLMNTMMSSKDKFSKKGSNFQLNSGANITISIEDLRKNNNTVEIVKNCLIRECDFIVAVPKSRELSLDNWTLQNLFNGMVVVSLPGPGKQDGITFVVGEGNNSSLVHKHLANFKQWTFNGFFNRANLVWTPLLNKKVTSTIDTQKVSLEKLKLTGCFDSLGDFDPEILTAMFVDRKLFKVLDESLVHQTFQRLSREVRSLNLVTRESLIIANHVKDLKCISRKNLLFLTLKKYMETHPEENELSITLDEPGKAPLIPRTYLLWGNTFDDDLSALIRWKNNNDFGFENPLIIKPGQFSNRGIGISMAFNMTEAINLCKETIEKRKSSCSVIVQEYISKPLLFKQRKFDVRCYALVVRLFDRISYYWYSQGYARTSSYVYDQSVRNNLKVHLTNEAVQVKGRFVSPRRKDLWEVRAWQQSLLPRTRPVLPRGRTLQV